MTLAPPVKQWSPRLTEDEKRRTPDSATKMLAKVSLPFEYPALWVLSPESGHYRAGVYVSADNINMSKRYDTRPPDMRFHVVASRSSGDQMIEAFCSLRSKSKNKVDLFEDDALSLRKYIPALLDENGAYFRTVSRIMRQSKLENEWDTARRLLLDAFAASWSKVNS